MVRLSDAGWSVPRIAAHFGAHPQTVRYWIKAFLAGGFDALDDRPHTGQRSAITEEILAAVESHIGEGKRTWTAQQVADWVSQHYDITRSAKQWRKLLKRIGQSYKRTGRSLHHKQKPEEVKAAKQTMTALEQKGAMNCSTYATSTKREWR
jgi:transposase